MKKISIAKQEGSMVKVYDTSGYLMFQKSGKLNSYTSDNVSINSVTKATQVYDSKGYLKFTR